MTGVAPPKPENRNPVKPSPLVTAVAPGSRKDAVSFLLTSGKTVCFWHTSCFPTRAGVEGEQKTWHRGRAGEQQVLALQEDDK